MLTGLKLSLAQGLRRAAFSAGAGLCFLVGAGFLTVAGWIYLAETTSAQTAGLVIGAIWFAAGFVLLGLANLRPAAARRPHHAAHPPRPQPDGFGIAQAFLYGLEAGQGSARRK
ncbi:hypothetical protein [Vannielia litorea]|uniref:Uncharacterized protein n=1 Tax=Vannielia litorea TaxID=1217970 RepID=A0A1N6EWD0_9RHOB|nr:hypothetical protein [Vannielia litorea]SIN87402.1 hypothetical protein SAMN05444002_1164 [Vannielia litorea]